jgi:hypothetical protein
LWIQKPLFNKELYSLERRLDNLNEGEPADTIDQEAFQQEVKVQPEVTLPLSRCFGKVRAF